MKQKIVTKLQTALTNKNLKEILTKSSKNLFLRLIGVSVSYALVFFIISFYGAEDYGRWSYVFTLFFITKLLSSLGVKAASVRQYAEYESGKSSVLFNYYFKGLRIILVSTVIFTTSVLLMADWFSNLIDKPYLAEYIKTVAWAILPYAIIDYHSSIFKGLKKIVLHTFFENIGVFLFTLIIAFAFSFYYESLEFLFIAFVYSIFLLAIISSILLYKQFQKLQIKKSKDKIRFREILSVSLPMFFTDSMDLLYRWADIVVLGIFMEDTAVGAYSLVSRFIGLILIPIMSMNSIITPKMREIFLSDNIKELRNVIVTSTKYTFLIGLMPILVVVVFHTNIISLFNEQYLIATNALLILIFGQFLHLTSGSSSQLLNMANGHKQLMVITILSAVLNLILNILLIPVFQLSGAAISTTFTLVLNKSICNLIIKKRLNFFPVYIPFIVEPKQK